MLERLIAALLAIVAFLAWAAVSDASWMRPLMDDDADGRMPFQVAQPLDDDRDEDRDKAERKKEEAREKKDREKARDDDKRDREQEKKQQKERGKSGREGDGDHARGDGKRA